MCPGTSLLKATAAVPRKHFPPLPELAPSKGKFFSGLGGIPIQASSAFIVILGLGVGVGVGVVSQNRTWDHSCGKTNGATELQEETYGWVV